MSEPTIPEMLELVADSEMEATNAWRHDEAKTWKAIRVILEAMQKRGITLEDLQEREFAEFVLGKREDWGF